MARQMAELSFAVPQVVGHRVLRMATAGSNPSARDRKEFALMGNEKIHAFMQSWGAMWVQMVRIQLSMAQGLAATAWAPFLGRRGSFDVSRHAASAAAQLMAAGLAPVHAKAVANSRRLARTHR
jgi:hypothetical protein